MKKIKNIGLLAVALVSMSILLIPNAFAWPGVYGYTTGPSKVPRNQVFSVTVYINNYGSSPAYYTSVRLYVPSGFSVAWGSNPTNIGTLSPGNSRALTFQVKAPSYETSGYIYAIATYYDNPYGYGTLYSTKLGQSYIQAVRGIKVTAILYSTAELTAGTVVLYDASGRYVTSGSASSAFGSSQLNIELYVLNPGTYKASASAKLINGRNALGSANVNAYGDASVSIFCIPI
ncbi:MAG: NEW3 domain-containing protein [Candidatus Bathyarchaeia archaeon]